MIDPGDWLPLVGVVLLAGTTMLAIMGAYVIGKTRRPDPLRPPDTDLTARVERMERIIDAMSVEMERVGEGQRFMVKMLGDAQITPRAERHRAPERIITPH